MLPLLRRHSFGLREGRRWARSSATCIHIRPFFGDYYGDPRQRRDELLADPAFQGDAAMARVMARLADEVQWQRLIRYHGFDNAQKTSNHVERANREYRRRQRSHYRLRSVRALWALLNLTLMSRPMPSKPVRLTRKRPLDAATREVLAA